MENKARKRNPTNRHYCIMHQPNTIEYLSARDAGFIKGNIVNHATVSSLVRISL
jgi:hypothetical protein